MSYFSELRMKMGTLVGLLSLLIVLLVADGAPAQGTRIRVEDADVRIGCSSTVRVVAEAVQDLGAAQCQVEYDGRLVTAQTCIGDPTRSFGSGALALCNLEADDQVVLFLMAAARGVSGSPVLFEIPFEVPEGASTDSAALSLSCATLSDSSGGNIVASLEDGTVTIHPSCAGDCNCDGTVAVDELVTGMGVALGMKPIEHCAVFDQDNSAAVEVNELVLGVSNTLRGCPQ